MARQVFVGGLHAARFFELCQMDEKGWTEEHEILTRTIEYTMEITIMACICLPIQSCRSGYRVKGDDVIEVDKFPRYHLWLLQDTALQLQRIIDKFSNSTNYTPLTPEFDCPPAPCQHIHSGTDQYSWWFRTVRIIEIERHFRRSRFEQNSGFWICHTIRAVA